MVSTITRSGNAIRLRGPGHDVQDDPSSSNSGEDWPSPTPIFVDPVFEGPAFTVTAHDSDVGADLLGLTAGVSVSKEDFLDDLGIPHVQWRAPEAPSPGPNYLFQIAGEPTDWLNLPILKPDALASQMVSGLAGLYRPLSLAAVSMTQLTDEQREGAMDELLPDQTHKSDLLVPLTNARLGLVNIGSNDERLAKALSRVLRQARDSQQMDGRLRGALQDLREAPEEAEEEGFPAPSQVALRNAERFLVSMFEMLPHRPAVYPTPDGEVAIHARVRRGSSVLMLCDSHGGALCLVNISGRHRRKYYEPGDDSPDTFLEKALADLGSTT